MKLKVVIFSLVILISYFVVIPAQAAQFNLGEHYVEIKGKQTTTPEIREFFSFYCSHCYRLEPLMSEVKELVPDSKQFVKNHVGNMPGSNPEIEHLLTKSVVTADLLNVKYPKLKDKIVAAIFTYIHKSKAKFSNLTDVKNLFLLNGVESAEFDKTFGSFKVKMTANQMRKKSTDLRQQGITGVPTLIINGKYKLINKSVKSNTEYMQLIKFLLAKTA